MNLREDAQSAILYRTFRQAAQEVLSRPLDPENFTGIDMVLDLIDARVMELTDQVVVVSSPTEESSDDEATARTFMTNTQNIEDGIFNLVISLVLTYSQYGAPETARKRVAAYLQSLIDGLDTSTDNERNNQP